MARNQGGNTPEYSIVDVRHSDPTKDGNVWRVTTFAHIKHRTNTPPDDPIEVAIFIDGQEVGRNYTDEHGRIEVETIITDPRRYRLEAQIVGKSIAKGTPLVIAGDKKKETKVEYVTTSEVVIAPGHWLVIFKAFDCEDNPVKGVIIEVFDATLPGRRKKLDPTDESGVTTYEVAFASSEHNFDFSYGKEPQNVRLWR